MIIVAEINKKNYRPCLHLALFLIIKYAVGCVCEAELTLTVITVSSHAALVAVAAAVSGAHLLTAVPVGRLVS